MWLTVVWHEAARARRTSGGLVTVKRRLSNFTSEMGRLPACGPRPSSNWTSSSPHAATPGRPQPRPPPFQPLAMSPAQLAAVSSLARYSGRTHSFYAFQLRRWFSRRESNGLDPLVGIQRAGAFVAPRSWP
jgi:hypothetical protein